MWSIWGSLVLTLPSKQESTLVRRKDQVLVLFLPKLCIWQAPDSLMLFMGPGASRPGLW